MIGVLFCEFNSNFLDTINKRWVRGGFSLAASCEKLDEVVRFKFL